MIKFERVSKRYPGGVQALSDVSFHLEAGEMAFLTGHSGAGKSTLLRLIALLDRASRGQVFLHGRNLANIPRRKLPLLRRSVGVIFQDHKLLSDKTVFDNVALPLLIAGWRYQEISKRVRAALDQVDLLRKERVMPVSLSGGEQQRVGIARAIVSNPPVLLADEPTGNLDPDLSADLMTLFCRLNELGTTVLIASHDIALIQRLQRRVLVLEQGKILNQQATGALA